MRMFEAEHPRFCGVFFFSRSGAAGGLRAGEAEVAAVPPSVPVRVAHELQLAGHRYLDVRYSINHPCLCLH